MRNRTFVLVILSVFELFVKALKPLVVL